MPDAADRRIPAAHEAFFPVLLAPRLGDIGVVFDAQAEIVITIAQVGGDVKTKGGITAAVAACLAAVDKYFSFKVNRAKAQKDSLTFHVLRHCESASVPHHRVGGLIADAALLALIAKGDQDLLRQFVAGLMPAFITALVVIIKTKGPQTIQVMVSVSFKIGPRMLGPWDIIHTVTSLFYISCI